MHHLRAVISLFLFGVALEPVLAAEPPRRVELLVAVDRDGLSDIISFTVPESARSVTFVAEGDDEALIALHSYVQSDEVERVVFTSETPLVEMRRRYMDEETSYAPSALAQTMRLGTFVATYPVLKSETLVPGVAKVRLIVAAQVGGPTSLKLTILIPEDDGATTLPVNLVSLSPNFDPARAGTILQGVQSILGQAGITVSRVDNAWDRVSPYRRITDFFEPQETPQSQAAAMARRYGPQFAERGALNVYIVDGLAAGGISLGIPGPPLPESYYFGVIVKRTSSRASMSRVMAHEISHFLGLHHITNRALSGLVYQDPQADTRPGADNLMATGTVLTPQQIFSLLRSPLLVKEAPPAR